MVTGATRARRVGTLVAVWLALGCGSLLDVENPNSVTDDDIRNNAAAEFWANGALYSAQVGLDRMLRTYAMVSDEFTFFGLNLGLGQLDLGHIGDRTNTATAVAYADLAAASWVTREAVFVLDSLQLEAELVDPEQLVRSLLYEAITLSSIASLLDDFAFADRTEPGPAVGPDQMTLLFDSASSSLTRGLQFTESPTMRRDLLAMRAQVRHAQAVWSRLGVLPIDTSAGGLVLTAQGSADAQSALLEDGSDWRFEFEYDAIDTWSDVRSTAWNNSTRGNVGERYVVRDANRNTTEVVLLDPIDSIPDPWLERYLLTDLASAGLGAGTETVFSAREMHLIVAEDALARGDTTAFADAINAVRSVDALTSWTPGSGVSARDLLIYQRQVNLFLQGHRLHDMYRFGITVPQWVAGSDALDRPGTFFPIPQAEIDVNCHLNPDVNC